MLKYNNYFIFGLLLSFLNTNGMQQPVQQLGQQLLQEQQQVATPPLSPEQQRERDERMEQAYKRAKCKQCCRVAAIFTICPCCIVTLCCKDEDQPAQNQVIERAANHEEQN